MSKLIIDGYKDLSQEDLIRFQGSKFYLDTFKSKEIKLKQEEVKSNKVYLALYTALKATGSYAVGLGDISRSKEIWLEFNGIPIKVMKATATDSDTTPVANMSLCCNSEVGQKKYCKSCGKEVSEVGKMVKLGKDLTIPIAKEKLEEIRAIRQKPYAIFADDKGLCLSEIYYSSKIRPHSVDTDGYAIGEEEVNMVKEAIVKNKTDFSYTDDYTERLQTYIENPEAFVSVEQEIKTDFNMSDLFATKQKVLA